MLFSTLVKESYNSIKEADNEELQTAIENVIVTKKLDKKKRASDISDDNFREAVQLVKDAVKNKFTEKEIKNALAKELFNMLPESETKSSKNKQLKESDDSWEPYDVVVGFHGFVGIEQEYTINARSKQEAVDYALDQPGSEAEMDLSAENIEDDGDGQYTVTINFAGYIGSDEDYTVYAESEEEAEQLALEEAKNDLEVISVNGEDFVYESEKPRRKIKESSNERSVELEFRCNECNKHDSREEILEDGVIEDITSDINTRGEADPFDFNIRAHCDWCGSEDTRIVDITELSNDIQETEENTEGLYVYSNAESEDKSDAQSMIWNKYKKEAPKLNFQLHKDGNMYFVDFIGEKQDIIDAIVKLGYYTAEEVKDLIKPFGESQKEIKEAERITEESFLDSTITVYNIADYVEHLVIGTSNVPYTTHTGPKRAILQDINGKYIVADYEAVRDVADTENDDISISVSKKPEEGSRTISIFPEGTINLSVKELKEAPSEQMKARDFFTKHDYNPRCQNNFAGLIDNLNGIYR